MFSRLGYVFFELFALLYIQQNKKTAKKKIVKIVVLQRFVRRTFEIQTTKHRRTVNQCKTLHHPNCIYLLVTVDLKIPPPP